jgi:hypothetical protein
VERRLTIFQMRHRDRLGADDLKNTLEFQTVD